MNWDKETGVDLGIVAFHKEVIAWEVEKGVAPVKFSLVDGIMRLELVALHDDKEHLWIEINVRADFERHQLLKQGSDFLNLELDKIRPRYGDLDLSGYAKGHDDIDFSEFELTVRK